MYVRMISKEVLRQATAAIPGKAEQYFNRLKCIYNYSFLKKSLLSPMKSVLSANNTLTVQNL